jgi:dTDP-4-dehydrorhamnose reductase
MTSRPETVLVLGASGMLGNAMFRVLSRETAHQIYGTCRSPGVAHHFPLDLQDRILSGIDVENVDALTGVIAKVRPTVVVNCVGIVKQLADAHDPLIALPINAILPHRLARLCDAVNARFIHISTDCVFDGKRGSYLEIDTPNATDLYGRSKLLGEVDYPNAVTLRTSIIGRENASRHGLVDWFLSLHGRVNGYSQAIFSGLTTIELSRVIATRVMPQPSLHGVYHVSVEPISKYDLLCILAEVYARPVEIVEDRRVQIDRSLRSDRFRQITGYEPPSWHSLIQTMHDFYA